MSFCRWVEYPGLYTLKYHYGDKIKQRETGNACNMYGRNNKNEKDRLKDTRIYQNIILKWILEIKGEDLNLIYLAWCMEQSSCCEKVNKTLDFVRERKKERNLLSKLASQKAIIHYTWACFHTYIYIHTHTYITENCGKHYQKVV